jgi:flagellar hook-basal body complex protein FliE
MAAALERGDMNASLPEVMIALQKASLSFQAMTEVRNRLVSAYQEIMNMPM